MSKPVTRQGNAATVVVTLNSIMKHPAFQQGMIDAKLQRPFLADSSIDAQWHYERGRLFAANTGRGYLTISRGAVSQEQISQFSSLLKDRSIL